MHTFFYGWRRKTGCAILLLALAVMAGWVRSLYFTDELNFGETQIGSVRNGLFAKFARIDPEWRSDELTFRTLAYDPTWPSDPLDWWKSECQAAVCDKQACGFRFAKVSPTEVAPDDFELWIIPYWSVVLPLTLLAAMLLTAGLRGKIACRSTPQYLKEHIATTPTSHPT